MAEVAKSKIAPTAAATAAEKSNVSELNNDVSRQVAILREDIAALTAAVAEYGKAQGNLLKESASNRAASVANYGAETAQAVKARAEKTYSDTEEAVRANPAAAVGIATGIGFLIGLITARR